MDAGDVTEPVSRRRRPPWPEIALAIGALLVAGLLAELGLRRFYPIHGLLYRLHPRYLHVLVPGARKLHFRRPEDGGTSVLVTVNGDGFLGPPLETPKRRRRVVVYGDSFVAGEFSPLAERFPVRLAALLSVPGSPPVEAVNAAVVGYGPDQEALRLEDELPVLQPDLVVVGVFAGNDFGDLVRDKIFRLDPQGRLEARSPRISPSLQAEFAEAERDARGSLLLRGLRDLWRPPGTDAEAFLLPPGGFPYLLRRRQVEFALSIRQGGDEVEHLFGDPYDADLSLLPGSESARYKAALMEQVLRRMAAAALARSTPIVFVFIPSAFDVGEGFEHPDPAAFPAYRPFNLTDALCRGADHSGLLYVDLCPAFAASRPRRLYFRGDEHWNAAGQALAAQLTASFVRAHGLLP